MSGKPKNSSDLAAGAKKGGKHANRRGKHRARPCPNPPAAPTGVVVSFKVREIKTHLEFSAKIKWNGVFEDEQGHKIPGGGVEIDHYEGQFRPTDAVGVPKETEDGDERIRKFNVKSVKGIKVTDAVIVSGTTAEFTTKKNHNFVVGERVRVQDVKPSAYNGRWTVLSAGLTATKFRADIGASPTNTELQSEGTVEGEPDPNYNKIFEHVSNPKKWYWQARVRAWDNKNCASDWSDWTSPLLPFDEALPKPPAPGFVSLTFDKKGRTKHNPWRGKVKIDPVTFWDVPGGDQEDDMARYHVKVQVSEDGLTDWNKHAILHVRDSDDEKDEDTNILLVFHRIRRKFFYRVWLASSDRYGRKGDYAGPYPSTVGVGPGGTPNTVSNVVVTRPAPRRFKATWDEPNEPEDIDFYKIEWWRRNPLTLMETNRSRNRNDVYRVPEADKGKAHFPKVYAVDIDDNESAAVQPGDQDETGDFAAEAPGTVKKFAGGSIPSGWLRCNGDVYSTSTYPDLFGAIGYTYGPPNSGSTFAVPDFRRRGPRGVGTSQALGENDGVAETDRMDNHGDHRDHRHKHHHKRRRRDHSAHGDGDTSGGTPHSHNAGSLNVGDPGTTVPRGTATSFAAGPNHQHTVGGQTASGGFHEHKLLNPAGTQSGAATSGVDGVSGYTGGYGGNNVPEHEYHVDQFVDREGGGSIYDDSLTGGSRFDGTSWTGEPTDTSGNAVTVDEIGAASGHKRHGHLRLHFIIKT